MEQPLPMAEFERQFIAFMTPPGKSENDALWKVTGRGDYWLAWWLRRMPKNQASFAAQIEGGTAIWERICWENEQSKASLNEIMVIG